MSQIVLAVVLALVAGLLAAVDAALSSFSRARAEELAGQGRAGARQLMRILDDPAPAINLVLWLRVVAETAAVVLITLAVAANIDQLWRQAVLASALMVIVSYVLIGVGPRTLGRQHAERVALWTAAPVRILTALLGPVPRSLIVIGNALTPGEGFHDGPFASEVEVRELVDVAAATSVIESDESRMIHSVFELDDTIAREVMVPRTDIVFIEQTKTLRQAMSLALRSGFSRLPVIGGNLDDLIGMAYLKDITKRTFDNHDAETSERIDSISRPAHFVPDTKPANDLLRQMQEDHFHVAVVVDEFGGTAGMVTIEDILEQIVGDIADEYDQDTDAVMRLSDGSVRVSSRYPIHDLDELFGIDIDDDDVDSVGGLLAKELGLVPIAGSVVEIDGLRLEAEAQSGRRKKIATVVISRVQRDTDAESIVSSHGNDD